MATILIVEDEFAVARGIEYALQSEGYEVAVARSGEDGLEFATTQAPDLIVLDVMLPDEDGFQVLRQLRKENPGLGNAFPPVLFLTARDAPEDRITGLRAGGDDYVTKPFNLEELVLRIQAVLRRTSGQPDLNKIVVGDLELDLDSHEVIQAGVPVQLSPTEFNLLRVLMENAGRVLSKAQLLELVWHYDFGGDDSIVASYISYLRRKIDVGEQAMIHTVRGTGYVLRRPSR